MMNKLRKKSSSNRSLDKASKEDAPATPPPRAKLDYHIPDSNFRSSLILPDLGRRFSLLARANQPELVKAKLAELRATGGELTKEEEDLVLEELKQLGQGASFSPIANGDPSTSSSSSSSYARGPGLSPIQTGDYHYRSTSSASTSATSPSDEVVHSPSHRSLFGASNRDVENMRKAQSNRGLTSSPSGELAGKGRRRLVTNGAGKERASTSAKLVSSSQEDPTSLQPTPSLASPTESTLLPSPSFVSTIDESPLEQQPPQPSASSTSNHDDDTTPSPALPLPSTTSSSSRSSRRKSLLDSLSPEQMKRVSSTLAQLEQSFFNTPLSINGTVVNGLPSQEELSTSRLPSVPEPLEDGSVPAATVKKTPGKPRSASNASSMASVVTNGGGKGGHRGARSGSISASEGRLTGYIPGMPRPITPQSRAGSSTSSTPRFSTPTQITASSISPLSPTSPSEHLRSPSTTPSRRFDPSASSSTQNRFESYASSSLSSRRFSDDSELLPHELEHAASSFVLPSSFESGRTLMSTMDTQASAAGSVSDGQVASDSLSPSSRTRRSLAPSPEPPASSSSSSPVIAANGSGSNRSPLSSIHPESLREESEGEEDDSEERPVSSALDSSVSLVPTESGQGSSVALGLDDSSRTSSSYGNQVHTTLGFSAFAADEREEYLDSSRRSSSLIPDADAIYPIDPPSDNEHRSSSHSQFRYPPPSTSSMAIHGHDTMRFSTISGPLSSFQDSTFDGRPPSSSFSPPSQDLHPLHQSIYLSNNLESGINASSSRESFSSGGSSFHDEMIDSLAGTGEMDRGLSVLVDNGRRVDWDQLESASSKGKKGNGTEEDLKILGGLTMEDVVAIQERLVKDRVGGAKGEWVGGVGLGGAGLLLGAEIKVEREEEEREAGQEVWSHPPSDLGLLHSQSSNPNPRASDASSLPRSAPSFSTAGSEYSETFPQPLQPSISNSQAPSLATSHRSYTSGVGFHRPRPAPSPSPVHSSHSSSSPQPPSSSSPQPTENLLDTTTTPRRPITPTTPKDNSNQLTPSTPTNAKFSSSTPSTPLGREEIMDPDFISDYRAKIEAADKTIRELKKSPSMPKMGIRSRTKSIKRMPKNQISSPQLISTTARLNTTDLPLDLQTQSLGNSTGSSVSQRLRNMAGGKTSRPESPPPVPSSAPRSPAQHQQPAFFSRPSLDQGVHQAAQDRPAFVFPNRAASPSPAPPLPHKIGKAKRSFLGLLRSRKSSDVASHPPASYGSPQQSTSSKTRPSTPFSPQQPQPPVVDISRSSMDQNRTPTFPPSPFDTSARTPTLSHTPGSREEGSIHAFYDAAEKLGIDPAEVNQLLQRSTSSTARNYSSIRSNSISNSIDLTSPPLTRAGSKRSVVGGIPEEEDHLQQQNRPLRVVSVVDSEGGGARGSGGGAMNLSASVRSALNRAGSTKSRNGNGNAKGSGSVLRRTIIFASSDQSRMSSHRPAAVPEDGSAAANEFEVLTDGVANGMPSPLGSRFNLRHSTSSSRPPRSPSDGSFFRGGAAGAGGQQHPPPSPSETSFIRAGHSSTHASLYDLYYDENDPERSDTTQTSILPPSQSTHSIAPQAGQAVEILELANGDVVYSVLQGLRDMEDYDDERWDEHSDGASTMDRPPSSLIDEPVQLTFRGQQNLVEPHRSVFRPSRPARPETKVFYSSSKQVADLIAEISRSHDTGSLQFQAAQTPSPTSSSFPTSPPPAPLNLPPKRSISVRRRSQHNNTAALTPHHHHQHSGGGGGGRGVSDAPSLSPSQLSVETNLDRLMGSLMQQGAMEEGGGGKRESLA